MEAIIAKDEALHLGHVYKSQRHTIQVDFRLYVHDLLKEIVRGRGGANRHSFPPKRPCGAMVQLRRGGL
jgi:hypothetical protein